MDVITWRFPECTRATELRIYPIGDIHIGNVACDEELLQQVVDEVANDPQGRWIFMGDGCDFIQRNDPRFDIESLASWVRVVHLSDLVQAQLDRLMSFLEPIAAKCIGVLRGNHERSILKHYERDIYSEIITHIKRAGGFPQDTKLGLGDSGWIRLRFSRGTVERASDTVTVDVLVHHGFGGGRLAGAPALNMQRFLLSHAADLAIMGHVHRAAVQTETVEYLDREGNVRLATRYGCYAGTFLKEAPYARRKGYLPLSPRTTRIRITPYRTPKVRVEVR